MYATQIPRQKLAWTVCESNLCLHFVTLFLVRFFTTRHIQDILTSAKKTPVKRPHEYTLTAVLLKLCTPSVGDNSSSPTMTHWSHRSQLWFYFLVEMIKGGCGCDRFMAVGGLSCRKLLVKLFYELSGYWVWNNIVLQFLKLGGFLSVGVKPLKVIRSYMLKKFNDIIAVFFIIFSLKMQNS